MRKLWTCSGKAFGYLAGRILRTTDGYHVGCVTRGEIYGQDGFYLGEVKNEHYLIIDISKKGKRRKSFEPLVRKTPLLNWRDVDSLNIPPGFANFPSAAHFNQQSQVEDLLRGYIESD